MLLHDCTAGLLHMWRYFLLLFVLAAYAVVSLYFLAEQISVRPSLGDYIFHFFKGMEVYHPTASERFQIPSIYLLFHLFISFIVARYPLSDLSGYGKQILMRGRSRVKWLLSKYAWAVLTVCVCYCIVFFLAFAFSLVTGNLSLRLTPSLIQRYFGVDTSVLTAGRLILIGFLIPVMVSIALSFLELTLSIYARPLWGFMAITVLLAVSAYYCHPLLPGNYLMIFRSQFANPAEGVAWQAGLAGAWGLTVACVLAGIFRIRRYDVLQ